MRKTKGLTLESLAEKTPTKLMREASVKCCGEPQGQRQEGRGSGSCV